MMKSYLWPEFNSEDNVLLSARKRLTHVMCLITSITTSFYAFGELAVVIKGDHSYYSAILYFMIPVLFFILTSIVSREHFIRGASVLLIGLIYGFTLMMRFDTGLFAPGAVYFITLPMIGGMLLGVRSGIALSLVMIATYAGMFIFRQSVPPPARVITGDEFALQSMISFSVLGVLCAACALFFMSLMEKVIRHLQTVNAELEGYKANLERRVEERTKTIQAQAQELAEALEAQKRANILQNTLVSVVSHEIRTPLAIIDGHARRLARGAEKMLPEDIADRATTIQKSVKRLTQLIERTLESARYAEGAIAFQPRPFDIRSLLDDIVSREQDQTTTHRLHADLGDLPKTYCGDPNLLDHVFSNIISNAIKYAPEAHDIYIRAETENNVVVFQVRDCGVGIPASELSTITNRFFRASTAKGISGTGIGLFLTRRITEDHGGTLSIDSVEGEWTEVTARLPVFSAVCMASDCCDEELAA